MNKAFRILQRLREPSTWAGISALGLLFGLPDGTLTAIGQVIGGLAALGAIVLTEQTKADATKGE